MSDLTTRLFDDQAAPCPDPFELFEAWYAEAQTAELNDPNAMVLATVGDNVMPDIRTVLMNGRDRQGFVFYTNLDSAKARELANNPLAALLFYWKSLRRQIRIRGNAVRVDDRQADTYFASRPRQSQIGAHASVQSQPLQSRQVLVERVKTLEEKFANGPVPRPANWSGFRIEPESFEFWQNGEFRLHDRVLITHGPKGWSRQRLNP